MIIALHQMEEEPLLSIPIEEEEEEGRARKEDHRRGKRRASFEITGEGREVHAPNFNSRL